MTQSTHPVGVKAFNIVWFGQVISLLGTSMMGFALTIWAWEITGQATALALVGFFHFGPSVVLSPVAGALVDRWNRKVVMMLSDLAAGLATIVILALYATDHLQIWHLYVAGAFEGAFQSFQFPAYSAAVTMMVPKEQYARASGMLSLAQSASGVFAPMLAGALLAPIGFSGIMVIDIVTFVVAIGTLLFVHIPQPEATAAGREGRGSIWKESAYGFRYIYRRPSLLGLQLVFFALNLVVMFSMTVRNPMILARTGDNAAILGSVQSIGGIGGVIGGLLLSVWGGPKRRVHGVLIGMVVVSLLGTLPMGLGQGLLLWALAAFAVACAIPILNGSNQAIWQAKVAPDVQGRVFAVRRLIAQITGPLAMLIAGPVADQFFEPAMMPGGSLADTFGGLVGTGPGAGMALMFVISGILGAVVGLSGYAVRVVRNAEDLLPDHDAAESLPEPEPAEAPPWETAPAATGRRQRRRAMVAFAIPLIGVLVVGFAWLQMGGGTESEEGQVGHVVADVALETTARLSPTSTTLPRIVQQPTSQAAVALTPTLSAATPTAIPTTATSVIPVIAGSSTTFTLTVVNNGPSDATGVVVSDTLPTDAIFDWANASQGIGCTYLGQPPEANGGGVVLCDLGTLRNGASAAITIGVTIDPLMAGVFTNAAAVGANEADPNRMDNALAQERVVYAEADLAIVGKVPAVVVAGKAFSYTLMVSNNGPLAATGAVITNRVSSGVTLISAVLDGGNGCNIGPDTLLFDGGVAIVCDLGELVSGESTTATIFALVGASAEGAMESIAVVGAGEPDLHMLDNLTRTVTAVQVQADLGIVTLGADSDEPAHGIDLALQSNHSEPAVAGKPLTYTLTVNNHGPQGATGVILNDALPAGVTLVWTDAGSGGGCTLGLDGTLSCFLGRLDSGDSVSVPIAVMIDPAATGTITNTAAVAANEFDLDMTDNATAEEVVVTAEADLKIR